MKDDFFIDRPIGVIIPPPDIKKHIDRAASFVAKYGSNFESMLKLEEQNLPKFSFLKESDPYHPYYESVVNKISQGMVPGWLF